MHYQQNELLKLVNDESIDLEQESYDDILPNENEIQNRKLYIDKTDKSMSDLFRMICEGELKLQPDFQRNFVWDKTTMSRFIESLILSIPIPTIFLSENEDSSFDVIDGQQRLTTIFSFMKIKQDLEQEEFMDSRLEDMASLKLSGLETLTNLNGMTYLDLDDSKKRKFNNVSLPVVIIRKDSSEDVKYDIFSRINRGSVKLNNQELLNVMYRGVLIDKINEISNNNIVDRVFESRPILKKRFGYQAILLRAIVIARYIDSKSWKLKEVAIKDKSDKFIYKSYNGRFNSCIIDYLNSYRTDVEEAKRIESFILKAVERVIDVFGDTAFKRVNTKGATSINKTVAEVQLITLSRLDSELIKNNKERIRKSFEDFLLENDDLFTRATNNTRNLEKRYGWGRNLIQELKYAE